MLFYFKPIRPKKLKIDAFRLEFLTAMHEIEREVLKEFKKTTETWDHQPEWETAISLVGGPSVLVGTDDEIYRWVNDGVPEHDIVPKKAGGVLAFKRGYKAKTSVGVIASRRGGKFGKRVVREYVTHPGIEARNFDKVIKKAYEKRFKKRIEKAMKIAVQKSGHGV